ncbi:unnamed protein product [Ostreobium quekettii]|uniref:Uncharacterized protein n=1 Tax=Ostreobium quekettii TaxID=121088 RepID=A0A8S1IZ85_9CHLO|nr:unnamed protein product [Ostreobium quekettii]
MELHPCNAGEGTRKWVEGVASCGEQHMAGMTLMLEVLTAQGTLQAHAPPAAQAGRKRCRGWGLVEYSRAQDKTCSSENLRKVSRMSLCSMLLLSRAQHIVTTPVNDWTERPFHRITIGQRDDACVVAL